MNSPIISMDVSDGCIQLVDKLNDLHSEELSLPGNWSAQLFNKDFPIPDTKIANALSQFIKQTSPSYLDFYQEIYQNPHPTAEKKEIWKVFSSGSIMLYFEPLFLRMLDQPQLSKYDQVMIQYLDVLSKTPITKWDTIVSQIGACCHQFFIKEPESYIPLIFRTSTIQADQKSDFEILKELGLELLNSPSKGNISCQDSRSKLIDLYQSITQSK